MKVCDLTYDEVLKNFAHCDYPKNIWGIRYASPLPIDFKYSFFYSRPKKIDDNDIVYKIKNVIEIFPNTTQLMEYPELRIIDPFFIELKDGSVLMFNGKNPERYVLFKKGE